MQLRCSGAVAGRLRVRLAAARQAQTAARATASRRASAAAAPPRVDVVGAGLAGMAVAYHLLSLSAARATPVDLEYGQVEKV